METTPYPVWPYAMPMLFCVVVSTTAIKTQADFASYKIFHSDFNSDSSDAFAVELLQNVIHYPSISFADPDWTFIHGHLLFIRYKIK